MIHIKQIRINCNKKLYKRKPNNIFVRNEKELESFLETKQKRFLANKFPGGVPEQDPYSRTQFCTTDSTHITVPDKEFLHYLVTVLNMKSIPEKYVELLKPNTL